MKVSAFMPSAGKVKRVEPRRVLAVVRHPVGGIRTHLLYTYPFLAEQGYRFTFVLPAIEETRGFRSEVESWPGTEVIEAPVVGVRHPQCMFIPAVRRLLRQRRFDLIHSQGIRAATQVVVANFGIGVPHVATSQDMVRREDFYAAESRPWSLVRAPRYLLNGLSGRLKLATVSMLLSRLDALVTVTNDARQNHLDFFPRLRKLQQRVVPIINGIRTDLFNDECRMTNGEGPVGRSTSCIRDRCGVDENVFLAGFLGRFMEQKGFLVLVDAMERLAASAPRDLPRPVHLVAMESGDFVREYSAIVRSRPRVASCITFLPREPNVAPVLRQLDALVMPSLWEACGILAMEAMALGVPVIGSNCPGLREVLSFSETDRLAGFQEKDTPSRMVPPNDPDALARALREAVASPRKQEAIAYAAQARQRFDARHTAASLAGLFEKVCATAGRA